MTATPPSPPIPPTMPPTMPTEARGRVPRRGPDRSVLVTGATSGLGLATAATLARSGAHVLLSSRSAARGAATEDRLRRLVPGADIELLVLDVADLVEVRSISQYLADTADHRPPLAAVAANAAVQVLDGVRVSPDGYELTFATAHLGHLLLVALLATQLAETRARGVPGAGRVVMVGSGTHAGPWRSAGFPAPRWADAATLADPAVARRDATAHGGRVRYATAKLAVTTAGHDLSRRYRGSGPSVTVFDPGLMPATALARDYPERTRRAYARLAPVIARAMPSARTPEASGRLLSRLLTDPTLPDLDGLHVVGRRDGRPVPRSAAAVARDPRLGADLYEESWELVGRALRDRPGAAQGGVGGEVGPRRAP